MKMAAVEEEEEMAIAQGREAIGAVGMGQAGGRGGLVSPRQNINFLKWFLVVIF